MPDFDLLATQRLPLADGCLRLLKFGLCDDFLEEIYQRHRGRSYTRKIAFADFVSLFTGVFLGTEDSPHQAFSKAREADPDHEATAPAWYGKLSRLPIPLSQALFLGAAERMARVGTPVAGRTTTCPDSFRAVVVDGKKLKYVAKRLKPLRKLKGEVFGGKLLVAQDLATGRALAVEAEADGEAADNPLVPGLVRQVRSLPSSAPRVWLADRAFCEFATLNRFSEGGDRFLVRHNRRCGFHVDPSVPGRTGTDDAGRPFREEWGWLGDAGNPNRVRVRRIVVERAGADPLALVSNLMDAEAHPAADLLALYRRRWGVETMFQHLVQVFDVRHLIGSTPQATVFQAVLCLLLHNTTLIVRDHVAAAAGREGKSASTQLIFREMVRQLSAWLQVVGPAGAEEVLRTWPSCGGEELGEYLKKIFQGVWRDRWKKAKTTKRGPRRPPETYLRGGHSSVHKILRGEHRTIPITPRSKKETTS